MRGFYAPATQRLFHCLKLGNLISKLVHPVFSQQVINETRVSLSGAAKGDNLAVVVLSLLIAGIDVLELLLLRGVSAIN